MKLLTVAGHLALIAAVGGLAVYVLHKKTPTADPLPPAYFDERLREAVAEVDRLDPRWRFDDLEADRARVPAEENAAPLVMASALLIPAKWNGLDDSIDLRVRLRNGELDKNPRAEIEPARAALFEARQLAGFSRGRHAVTWNFKDPLATPLPHVGTTENIIDLLTLDAEVLAHEGKIDEALVSVRAALVAARTMGDEPMLIAQVQRLKWEYFCAQALEESLRRGQATEGKLLSVQKALEAEADEPILRTTARAERAGLHGLMTALEKGELTREELPLLGVRAEGAGLVMGRRRATLEAIHAWLLEYTTQFVEIAGRPSEEQAALLKELATTLSGAPLEALPLLRALPVREIGETCHKARAVLRSAAVGVALERYRLANGRWPDTLAALVPKYLKAVPADPFDGKPLRYREDGEGAVVWCLGTDRKDDGGDRATLNTYKDGTDVGFRLWDVEKRGAPRK